MYHMRLMNSNGTIYAALHHAPGIMRMIAMHNWCAWFTTNAFDVEKANVLVALVLFGALIWYYIHHARRGRNLYIRPIAGLQSVHDAIGRATELGKPILYVSGIGDSGQVATIAAMNILGCIARDVAEYDTTLCVPCIDPIVMTIEQELVKQSYLRAGRPENYRKDSIFYVSSDQFAYATAVSALMVREKPAANFFMGSFAAEALLLAEAGSSTGAIQIAGTDASSQIPFFVVACDYTIIGEELYAAGAYLSREPLLLGSLKGQDIAKLVIMVVLIVGIVAATVCACIGTPMPAWFLACFKA